MSAAETARLLSSLDLDDSKFQRGIARSLGSLGKLDKGFGRIGKGAGQLGGGLLRVGVVAAGAAAAGLGLAAKKAIDMDDAFAGVVKTVGDASKGQLQDLNNQLHALATRIPVNYQDLAGIAAEAGALGVHRQDIVGFTDTVARLSAATQGLTTEQAAEAFGKFKNSLQLSEKQIEQSASALIALGNAGASSEGDIIEIGKRFAGAGRTAGLSAAQVLGLSSAIASVGVQPEAAGGSLSRLFNNINKYIGTGDKKLQAFAKTTGQTTKGFAKAFQKDALGSFEKFLKGISTLSGPEQAKRLKEAGVVNVRDISAIQLLAHSYGEVKRQTDLATDAFNKNRELTDVSNQRFDTLKNKLQVLGQNFQEAGYNISQGFLPAVGRAADKMTAFLQKPENIAVLKSIGQDLGKAIDKIDFNKLLGAAQGLAKAFDPALQVLLKIVDLISSLPPEVVGAGGGLLVANKISGGAIATGAGNIVGGLGEALAKTLASQIPLFGRAFVQPVFVTNPGFGGGTPGIPGGGGGGSPEGGGGGAKLGGTAGAGIFIADMHAFNSDMADRLEQSGTKFGQDAGAAFREQANKVTPWDEILHALGLKELPTPQPTGPTSRDKGFEAAGSTPWRDLGRKQDAARAAFEGSQHALASGLGAVKDTARSGLDSAVAATRSGTSGTTAATNVGASRIVGAIASNRPIVNTDVHVTVTSAGVEKATTTATRYGEQNGSAGGGGGHAGSGSRLQG